MSRDTPPILWWCPVSFWMVKDWNRLHLHTNTKEGPLHTLNRPLNSTYTTLVKLSLHSYTAIHYLTLTQFTTLQVPFMSTNSEPNDLPFALGTRGHTVQLSLLFFPPRNVHSPALHSCRTCTVLVRKVSCRHSSTCAEGCLRRVCHNLTRPS